MKKTKISFSTVLTGFFATLLLFFSCEVGLGEAVDTRPPSIVIEKPEVDKVIRQKFLISGTWEDDGTIDSVYVLLKRTDGKLLDGTSLERKIDATFTVDELDDEKGTWQAIVDPLEENNQIIDGSYQATVVISDKGRHSTTQITTFTIDNTAPVLILSKPNSTPQDQTLSAYGQRLFLEGSIADSTKETWVQLDFYSGEECTEEQYLTTIETGMISPTDVNSNNARLAIYNTDLTQVYATEYYQLYGATEKSGSKQIYAKLTVYDTAETFPVEGEEDNLTESGKIKGNSSQSFYLTKKLAESITKSQTANGYGLAWMDIYYVLNGTYVLKNESRAADAITIKEELLSEEQKKDISVFTINPENSPYFTISGLKTLNLDGKDFEEGNTIVNGTQTLEVSVFMGSDSIALKDDENFYVYLLECDKYGKPVKADVEENRIKLYSKYKETGSGSEKKTYYKIGGKTDHKTSSGAYVFSIPMNKSLRANPDKGIEGFVNINLEFGKNYIIRVSGKDTEDNEIETTDGGYGFSFTAGGVAPRLTITEPADNTVFIKKGDGLHVEGSIISEGGMPRLTITNAETIVDVNITPEDDGSYSFSGDISPEDLAFDQNESVIYSLIFSATCNATESTMTKSVWYDVEGPVVTMSEPTPLVKTNSVKADGKTVAKDSINGVIHFSGSIIDEFDSRFGSATYKVIQNSIPVNKPGLSGPLEKNVDFYIDTTKLTDKLDAEIVISAYDKVGNLTEYRSTYYVDQSTDEPLVKTASDSMDITKGRDESILGDNKNLFVRGSSLVLNVEDDDSVKRALVTLGKKNENGTFEVPASSDETGTLYKEYASPSAISHQLPTAVGIYLATVTAYDKNYKSDTETPNSFTKCEFIIRVTGNGPSVTLSKDKDFISTLGAAGTNKLTFDITDEGNGPYQFYKNGVLVFNNKTSPFDYSLEYPENTTEADEITFEVMDKNQGFTDIMYKPQFDNTLPEVAISATPTTSLTEESSYLFKGTMSDTPSGIEAVKIKFIDGNNPHSTTATASEWIDCIAGSKSWNYEAVWASNELKDVFEREGNKSFIVKAIDNAGNEKTVSDTFVYDKMKPVVQSIAGADITKASDVVLTVNIKDTNPIKPAVVVKQNGTEIQPTVNVTIGDVEGSGTDYTSRVIIPFASVITSDGVYEVEVIAKDANGKSSSPASVKITRDSAKPLVTNVKLTEEELSKDAYYDDGHYYVNNTKSTYKISGIATDNIGVDSVALVVTNKDDTTKTAGGTYNGSVGQWSFTGIDLKAWTGSGASAKIIVKDQAGNEADENVNLDLIFDVIAPSADHKIDDSQKNLEFRIGDAPNDAGEEDVGGKYSNGSYGSALTMQLRGNFPDNAGGSGINKFYYKTFNNQEVKIDSSITGSDPVVGTGENEGKIFFKDDAALIAYVVANKTDVFSPIAVETRNVEYNIGPYEPETWVTVPTASVRFGGSATTTANASGQYKSNKKGYVQFRTSVDTNFKTTMKDFVEGKNYLVIVAQDNAGNLGLDTATVAGVEYPCYSLNVDITAPTIPTKQSGTVYTNLAGSTPVNISGTVSDKSSSEYGSSGLNKIVFTSDQTDANVTVSSSAFTAVDASENPNNDPTLKRWTADIRSLLNADGTAIISAKVSDNAGYETSVPVANVMVDSTAPAVIINSPAANAKTGTTVSISGTVNDGTGSGIDTTKPMILYYTKNATKGLAGLDVADISGLGSDASAGWVKLDEFTPGSNGIWNYELNAENITAAGENNIRFFTVSATDKAGSGNTGIAEAVRITVDRKAPVSSEFKVDETEGTSLGSDTTVWFKNSTVNLNGTFTDQGGSGLSAVKYQLKKGSAEYETTQNVASDGSFSVNVKDLIDGTNNIKVWAVDAAGNAAAEEEYTIKVDSHTPVITTKYTGVIPANESACLINLFVTDEGSSGINKVQLKIGDKTVDCDLVEASTGKYSKDVKDILPQGTVSVTAIATDNAGNSTSSVIANVMLDTEGPVVTITSPSANAKIGSQVTVTGTADDRTGAGVDPDKNLILYYTTEEEVGNVTTAPTSITTSDDASTGWKAYNTTQILEEDGQNWSCTVDVTTLDSSLFPEDADTPVWFTVMATDKSGDGNKGYAIPRKAIVDRIKPTFDDSNSGVSGTKGVTVVSGKWFDATTLNIFGKFEDTTTGSGVKTIWYKLGNADDVSIATTDGTYNTNIQGFAAGTNTLKIWAVDAAGNQSDEITYTVKVDTIAPDLTESGIGTTGKTTNAGFTLSGKAWDANQLSRIEIKLGSQTWVSGTDSNISLTPETSEHASSNWTATFVTGSSNSSAENYVEDGTKDFTVTVYDVAGLSKQVSRTVVVDTQKPEIGTVSVSEVGGVTIDGNIWYKTTSVPVTVPVTDQGISGVSKVEYAVQSGNSATWTPLSYDGTNYTGTINFAGNGTQTLRLKATDVAGNVSTESTVSVNIDTSAPDLTALYYKKGTGAAEAVSSPVYLKTGTQITVYGNYKDEQSGVNALTFKMGDGEVTPTVTYSATAIGNSAETIPSDYAAFASISNKTSIRSWKAVYTADASGKLTAEGTNRTNTKTAVNIFEITIDDTVPAVSNVRLTEVKTGVANKDAYKNGNSYYVNSTGKTFTVSGIATDDIGVDSVSLSIEGTETITPTRSGTLGQWTYADIDLSSWSGSGTATVTVKDKAGNVTTEIFSIVFDAAAPVSKTIKINNQTENLTTRWYDSESLSLSGSYEDTGSGVARVYYKLGSTGTEKSLTPVYNETSHYYDYSTTIDFTGVTDRKLYIRAEDNAGNLMSDYTQYSLNIDTVSPEVTESGIGTAGKTTNTGFTLKGKAWDANELSRIEIKIGSKTWVSGTDSNVSLTKKTSDPGENQTNWTATFVTGSAKSTAENYVADGTNEITVTAYDVAGLSKQVTRTVVVDTVLPEADEPSITSTGKTVSGKTWFNSTFINIKVENVKDESGTGISKVEYSKDYGTNWSQMSGSGTTYTATVNCENQGSNTIQVRVTDAAENQTVAGSVTAYVDTKEPSLENSYAKYLTGDYEAVSELLINGDNGYSIKISAKDEDGGTEADKNSGIASVQYSYGSYTIDGEESGNDWIITVPKDGNGTNNYSDTGSNKIYVIIKDNAGNEVKERVLTVTKDETPPTVDIKSFTRAGSQTNLGTQTTPVLVDDVNGTITISGLADDTNRFGSVKLEYQKDGESSWTTIPTTSSTSWTTTLDTTNLTDNKKYTLKATATDAAGNTAEDTQVVYVNQDSDRPVITVTNPSSIAALSSNSAVTWEMSDISGTVSDDDTITYFGYYVGDSISYTATDYNSVTISNGIWKISDLDDGTNKVFFKITAGGKDYFANTTTTYNSATIYDTTNNRGTYRLTDGTNKFGYRAGTSPNYTTTKNELALVIDTVAPDVETAEYSLDDGTTWQTGLGSVTLGGTLNNKLRIRQSAYDQNTVKFMTVKVIETINGEDSETPLFEETYSTLADPPYVPDEDLKGNSKKYLIFTTNEINLSNWTTTYKKSNTDSNAKRVEITMSDGIKQTVSKLDLTIDNTPPEITFTNPESGSINSGEITVYGTTNEIGNIYYTVSTSETVKPSEDKALTGWTGYTVSADGSTLTPKNNGTITGTVKPPAYVQIPNAGVSWYVYFDGVQNDATRAHAVHLKNYATTLGVTTDLANLTDLVKFYIWIKIEDEVGNTAEYSHPVCVDPQGDRPSISLSNPEEPDPEKGAASVGGTVKLYGTADDSNGTVDSVWVQLLSAKNGSGYGTVTQSNNDITAFAPTANDVTFWLTNGYSVYYIASQQNPVELKLSTNTTNTTATVFNSSTHTPANCYIKANFSGSQWNLKINNNGEFDPASTSDTANDMAVRVYARDNEKNMSYPVTRYFKMDKDTPVISNVMLKHYTGNTVDASQEVRSGMFVKGTWYLEFTASDNEILNSIVFADSENVETAIPAASITKSSDNKIWSVKYELPTGTGVGNFKRVIRASDATNHTGTYDIDISYDNEAPKLLIDSSNEFDIASAVRQNNGFYKLYSKVSDESSTGTPSGVKGVGFYFMRRKAADEGLIYDPLQKRAEPISTKNLSYSDGLYWMSGSVTCDDSGAITLSTDLVDKKAYVHAGSYIKLKGVMYKITSVNDTVLTIAESHENVTTAQIALAQFVDNRKSEYEATTDKDSDTGYYTSIKNDDYDSMVEELGGTTAVSSWQGSIVSRNIPDGPIEIHYTAFDESLNYAVGIIGNQALSIYKTYTTPEVDELWTFNGTERVELKEPALTGNYASYVYTYNSNSPAYISNNAPRLAGVHVAVDYTGSGKLTDATITKFYNSTENFLESNGSVSTKPTTVVDNLVAANKTTTDGTTSYSGITRVKGKTWLIPEMVGGNGKLWYTYNIYSSGANGTKSTTSLKSTTDAIYFADGSEDFDEYKVNASGSSYVTSHTVHKGSATEDAGFVFDAGFFGTDSNDTGYIPNSELNAPTWFDITIYDSTETPSLDGTNPVASTSLAANQKAIMSVALAVQIHDELYPNVVINPFYWTSATNNSLYQNSSENGHIELENDWMQTTAYTNRGSDKELDADPKVSGKIKVEGYAYDNIRLSQLKLSVVNSSNTAVISNSKLPNGTIAAIYGTSWADSSTQGTVTNLVKGSLATYGWEFFVSDSSEDGAYNGADGHKVKWTLNLDTSKITDVAATDITVKVEAVDKASKSSSSRAENTTATTDADKHKPNYRVDVVPYITKLYTGISETAGEEFARSATGKYIVRGNNASNQTETVRLFGFNLSADSTNGNVSIGSTTGIKTTLSTTNNSGKTIGSHLALPVGNGTSSGKLSITVNGVASLNNVNRNPTIESGATAPTTDSEALYNSQANGTTNNRLTDDVDLWVWSLGSYLTSTKPIYSPVMKMDAAGKVYMAYGLGADQMMLRENTTSYIVDYGYNKFVNTAVAFSSDGKAFGMGTCTDRVSNKSASSVFYTWRTSNFTTTQDPKGREYTYSGSSKYHLEKVYNDSTTVYDTDRVQRPKMEISGSSDGAKVYMVYYDKNNEITPVKFRYGVVNGTEQDSLETTLGLKGVKSQYNSTGTGNPSTAQNNSPTGTGGSGQNFHIVASSSTTYKSGPYTAVGYTSTDAAVVAWYDASRKALILSWNATPTSSVVGGVWQTNAVIIDDDYAGWYTSMCIDGSDGIHLAYYNSSRGDLKYAYIPDYTKITKDTETGKATAGVSVVTVDSYLSVGTNITINTRSENGKIVPYIYYYNTSNNQTCNSIKVAWRKNMDDLLDGAIDDKFTGNWECMTVPTENIPVDATVCGGVPSSSTTAANNKTVFLGYMSDEFYEKAYIKGDITQ